VTSSHKIVIINEASLGELNPTEIKGTLLTSDKTLKQFASSKKVAVHGHLWLLDLMVEQQQLTGKQANAYLKRLKSDINPKLGLSDRLCQPFRARWLN